MRYPSDCLNVQRMYGKNSGDNEASQDGVRGPLQYPKQEQNVGGMKEDIDEVMRSRIQAKQLAIEHVRQPCNRMPVGLFKASKRPGDVRWLQSRGDVWIVGDVGVIIPELDEVVMNDWKV